MPGQRPILAMSFVASLGITFQLLACTVPKNDSNLWPLLVYIFYILLPIPILVSTHIIKETMVGMNDKDAAKAKHYAVFFTAGILVSSFAMPILLARSPEANPTVSSLLTDMCENFILEREMKLDTKSNIRPNNHTQPTNQQQIKPIQCVLVEIGNVMCYATMGLFCIYFKPLSN